MITRTHLVAAMLAGAVSLSAGLAAAQAPMKDTMPMKDSAGSMKSEPMKDGMAKDAMKKDSMGGDMKKDGMKKDDMKKDSMKK